MQQFPRVRAARTDRRHWLTGSLALTSAALLAALLAACQPAVTDAGAAPTSEPAPMPVAAARVASTQIAGGTVQMARVEAAQQVELRPRVAGAIVAVLFREGELVREGQPLFQIDPRPFQMAVSRARADMLLARTREAMTSSEASRARQLHASQAIASEEVERRASAHAEAQARLAYAEAALQSAQLELDFSLVRAPITGRVGRALVTVGNLVGAGQGAAPLTTLVSPAPLHVHFDLADRQLLRQLSDSASTAGWRALILDEDGQHTLAHAPVDFRHHSIDPATGTLRLRARVDRPQQGLLPGQVVRVSLDTGRRDPTLTVPDRAVGTDQGGHYVLVVDDDGKVGYRAIGIGAADGERRIVTSGLRAGETVVTSRLMGVRPGMTVQPQMAETTAEGSAPAAPLPDRS